MAEISHQSTAAGFRDVDKAGDPSALIAHLDGAHARPQVQERRRRKLGLLGLQRGDWVLDAGCGTGADLIEMTRLVAPTGRGVGVDLSDTMVFEARRRAEGSGLPVEFQQGDLAQLDFPDGTFHACHSERVLLHVEDPAAVLAEFVRVLRPNGRLVVFDLDFGIRGSDLPNRDVQRRIDAYRADVAHRNGWIGRQLPRLFKQAGLIDLTVEPQPIVLDLTFGPLLAVHQDQVREARDGGAITHEEAEEYFAAMDAALADGTFLSASLAFLVAGRKP